MSSVSNLLPKIILCVDVKHLICILVKDVFVEVGENYKQKLELVVLVLITLSSHPPFFTFICITVSNTLNL